MSARFATVCCALAAAVLAVAVGAPASAAGESISAQVTTQHPAVGQQLTIDGTVSGASSAMSTVSMTRTDSTGTTAMPVDSQPTDANGHFTLQDTPPVRGKVVYHLDADMGAATTDVVVQVAGQAPQLSIDVSPRLATVGDSVHVTAHLGAATTNRSVTLYAKPYQRGREQIDQGDVDASGNRATDHGVQRRTTFIAVFAGDSTYAPATVSRAVRARAVVEQHLRGGYGTAHGYRLYHHNTNPRLLVHVLPERSGTCIHFRAQHRSHGSWVKSAVSPCEQTDGTGRVLGIFQGPDHIVGVPYRLRAEWRGNRAVARRNGAWIHLEFHR